MLSEAIKHKEMLLFQTTNANFQEFSSMKVNDIYWNSLGTFD